MKRLMMLMLMVGAMLVGSAVVQAQVPYVTYYQPTNVYYPGAPGYRVMSPIVVTPTAPTIAYYPSGTLMYQTAPKVVTRYRPILGGTVSRVRYGYIPVYYPY